jgi:hypothetical protein
MVSHQKDSNHSLKVEFTIYQELDGSFNTEEIFFSELNEQSRNLLFLKKNIENIFNLNGLIDPFHEPVVAQGLRELSRQEENVFDKVHLSPFSLTSVSKIAKTTSTWPPDC